MADVFISYAHNDDEPLVRKVCGDLTAQGLKVVINKKAEKFKITDI